MNDAAVITGGAAGIVSGPIFRAINKGGRVASVAMTAESAAGRKTDGEDGFLLSSKGGMTPGLTISDLSCPALCRASTS